MDLGQTSPKSDAPNRKRLPIEPERQLLDRARKSAQLLKTSLTYCKADAVDALWRYAEDHDIVQKIGADRTQAILAEAFR